MTKITTKQLLLAQTIVLLLGTLFAWSKLLEQISTFQLRYGTLFRFRDCTLPNPFTTPCLYGSIAFLVALAWSYYLFLKPNEKQERLLRNFLIFCVAFAGTVFAYELIDYYKVFDTGGIIKSCSPGTVPFKTPCFYGLIFFTLACSVSFVITKNKKLHL
ncbi:MAG: hypothetical protein WC444_01255 [Candidatus Paceibacterota bacterium]